MMRLCLVIAILAVLSLPSILSAEQEFGSVVRIHFDESPVPDLSVIHDTYEGPGPTICAHIVIDSLPDGVSGYHLAYEIVSEDSSVVVLPGFHPSPGWVILDKAVDFALAGEREVARTPASVGYWRLWLRNGGASRGVVKVRPVVSGGVPQVTLLSAAGSEMAASRAYHGALYSIPPPADVFESVPAPDQRWASVPEVGPVWVLRVEGDAANVTLNEFASGRSAGASTRFPVSTVVVQKMTGRWTEITRKLVDVRDDGSVGDVRTVRDWSESSRPERLVGVSLSGTRALFAGADVAKVRDAEGVVVSELPYSIVYGCCSDLAQLIIAVAEQDLSPGTVSRGAARPQKLQKLLIMDFDGHVVYEANWTSCQYGSPLLSTSGETLTYRADGCPEEGWHVLHLREGTARQLGPIRGVSALFSPDGLLVMANTRPGYDVYADSISVYDIHTIESPVALWGRKFAGRVLDAALSDWPGYLCYGIGERRSVYREVFVVSAQDGAPVARLVGHGGADVVGPFRIVGTYLIAGCSLGLWGGAGDTTDINVFDLSSLLGRSDDGSSSHGS